MTRPRRLDTLFVSRNFPPLVGGSVTVYDALARRLSDRLVVLTGREDPETVSPFPPERLADVALPYRVHRIRRLRPPVAGAPSGVLGRIASFCRQDLAVMLSVLAATTRLILRHRIRNVVIGELVYGGWLVLPLRYLLGRRVIIYAHGEEISTAPESLADRLRPVYLRHAHGIVAVSAFCKSMIVSRFCIPPERIAVVANGVDEAAFCAPGPPPDDVAAFWRGARHRLVALGRLVARKGHEVLIQAMARLKERHPGARLAIIGDGPLRARLDAAIAAADLGARVRIFSGLDHDQVRAALHAAELFVLPTRTLPDGDTEGFGLVFLEAGAAGLPVVAGAAGGTVEAVVHGQTGLLVDGNDPDAVAAAVEKLLDDPALRARLGEGGRAFARKAGWAHRAGQFARLIDASGPFAEPRPAYQPPPAPPKPQAGGDAPALLVTVDCEECFAWPQRSPTGWWLDGRAALTELHGALAARRIAPLYLLTHPVLCDKEWTAMCARWREAGEAALGVHNHPWVTPPLFEWLNAANSYPCNLPRHLEQAKIATLMERFLARFGAPPIAYRAGRWGGSDRTPELLAEAGIPLDLSAAAGMPPSADGGPDHRAVGCRPWRAGPDGAVLVVPAAGLAWPRGPDWLAPALKRLRSARRFQRFTPESHPLSRLVRMAGALEEAGAELVCLSLHLSALVPGGSPYAADETAAREIAARMIALIDHLTVVRGWRPVTAYALAEQARRAPPGSAP